MLLPLMVLTKNFLAAFKPFIYVLLRGCVNFLPLQHELIPSASGKIQLFFKAVFFKISMLAQIPACRNCQFFSLVPTHYITYLQCRQYRKCRVSRGNTLQLRFNSGFFKCGSDDNSVEWVSVNRIELNSARCDCRGQR